MFRMDQPPAPVEVDRHAQFAYICDYREIRAARAAFRNDRAAEIVVDPMQILLNDLHDEAEMQRLDESLEREMPDYFEIERLAPDGSVEYALVARNSLNNGEATDQTWLKREQALANAPKTSLGKALPSVTALPPETKLRVYDRFIEGGVEPEQPEEPNQPQEPEKPKKPVQPPKYVEIRMPTPQVQTTEPVVKPARPEKKPRFSRFSKAVAAGVLAVSALAGSMFIGGSEQTPESGKSAVASFTIESTATTNALLSEDFARMVEWANNNPGQDFGDAMSNFYD